MTSRFWPQLVLATAYAVSLSTAALADDPKLPPPKQDTLQAVLDRIKQHAAGEAWKQPGFKDDAIEAWLDKLVGAIAKGADRPNLKLPVRFKDIQARQPQAGRALIPGEKPDVYEDALILGKEVGKAAIVTRCIVLSDGNVELRGAIDSIIVARGVVTVDLLTRRSIVVAGTLVQIEQDGDSNDADKASVIVSRGWAYLNRTNGTLVAAPAGITLVPTARNNLWAINAPVPQSQPAGGRIRPPATTGSRSIVVPNLPLESLPNHPLGKRLNVLGVLQASVPPTEQIVLTSGPYKVSGVMLEFEGRRLFADLDQTITDEAGGSVEALRGWRLTHVASQLAIFSGPEAETQVRF